MRTEYSFGAAYKTTDYSTGSAGTVYHLTTNVNARGQSTGVTYGNGVTASFTYGDDTGWLQGNLVKKGTATIQNYSYAFDDVGNVTSRQLGYGVGSSANLTETFEYDNLHRLERRTVNSALNLSGALAMTESYGYDAMGNLTSKPGVGSYSFIYDANGNVTNDSKRTFTYTAFDNTEGASVERCEAAARRASHMDVASRNLPKFSKTMSRSYRSHDLGG